MKLFERKYFVKLVSFLASAEGSLVDIKGYVALHLGQETGTSPPSCLLLDNHLCMCNKTISFMSNTRIYVQQY